MKKYKYDEVFEFNGQKLTKAYIGSLDKKSREALIEPIFDLVRLHDFPYPDDLPKVDKEWRRVLEYQPDLNETELYNNSSLGTYICKYFCKSFFDCKEPGKRSLKEIFYDDEIMRKLIHNRLGLLWIDEPGSYKECFNISLKMLSWQAARSARAAPNTSIFKLTCSKHLIMKYSNENDLIYDYSAGWGARMLGTVSCNRKYIAVDPNTAIELNEMKDYLKIKDAQIFNDVSENFCLDKESIDCMFSSPPYLSIETYSDDPRQACNRKEESFYKDYWQKTLENCYHMLKPNKYFIMNTNIEKMAKMADDYFKLDHMIQLRLVKSHIHKSDKVKDKSPIKFEPIYIFKKL